MEIYVVVRVDAGIFDDWVDVDLCGVYSSRAGAKAAIKAYCAKKYPGEKRADGRYQIKQRILNERIKERSLID